jgi:hypothetical protein
MVSPTNPRPGPLLNFRLPLALVVVQNGTSGASGFSVRVVGCRGRQGGLGQIASACGIALKLSSSGNAEVTGITVSTDRKSPIMKIREDKSNLTLERY